MPDAVSPPPTSAHWLVVGEFDPDNDTDLFAIEHPADCPQSERYPAEGDHPAVYDYDCQIGVLIEWDGIGTYFQHADDPDEGDAQAERVATGRWAIEGWEIVHPGGPWGSTEYSGGIRTVASAVSR